MTLTLTRSLAILATAALSLLGPTVAGAQQLGPSSTTPTTTKADIVQPSTTATTAAPTTTTAKILPADGKPGEPGTSPGSPGAATTTVPPKTGDPAPASGAPGPSTTAGAPSSSAPTTQPPSLSAGQVAQVLRDQQRSGANSTSALVEALAPLQNLGLTMDEALALGMGRFPLLGMANWTDDWLDARSGPPPHQHMGNDIFAAFDVPVRAPADGVVRFEDAGLGGKGAFVTTPDGTYYYMAHLNGFAKDLRSGATVTQGQVVGFNGDSGNAKGGAPHVHFEIHPRGGAAVNPKPILDAWVAEALARVPELLASFGPKPDPGAAPDEGAGVPQILMSTGLTRRFTAPSMPAPGREQRAVAPDFNRAVLVPLTPSVLAPLFDER